MKKATLTIVIMMKETSDNMKHLNDLKNDVDNGEIVKDFNEEIENSTVTVDLIIEDV
jgi:hypothetical protein